MTLSDDQGRSGWKPTRNKAFKRQVQGQGDTNDVAPVPGNTQKQRHEFIFRMADNVAYDSTPYRTPVGLL